MGLHMEYSVGTVFLVGVFFGFVSGVIASAKAQNLTEDTEKVSE